MPEYRTDADGKWEILGPRTRALVKPSQEWLDRRAEDAAREEQQEQEQQEALDNLIAPVVDAIDDMMQRRSLLRLASAERDALHERLKSLVTGAA
jgi:hypothetical protein